ncbi:MAG TPA: SNF2-related protein, partial [Candidatus Limnocylindrales bacterium]
MGYPEKGSRVLLPGESSWVTIRMVDGEEGGDVSLGVIDDAGERRFVDLAWPLAAEIRVLSQDLSADSSRVLAGMWTHWMSAANHNARTTMLAATTLRPYIHQANAVYGAMLPQPLMRFLLADEPGTGKTIMAGMYLREMQRLGIIRKALVVVPAGLVTKWQADFERFFGGGLRRVTADTVREHALDVDHDMWIVSLELA